MPGRTANSANASATHRAWPARHPVLTALAVVAALIAILIAIWDWNWFKGPVERQVEARTGRTFRIGGDLDADAGEIGIRKAALDAGARLHINLVAALDQVRAGGRHQRDAAFQGLGFRRNTDTHCNSSVV